MKSAAKVDHFISKDEGTLSRYYGGVGDGQPIYVVNRALGQATRIDAYSKLYERYRQPAHLTRLYCRPEHKARTRACVDELLPSQVELVLGPRRGL